jgi:hypothetical protein
VFVLVGAVASVGLLLGLATLVKPFWFVKSRKQGLQVLAASFVLGVISSVGSQATAPPPPMPERPVTITEEEWQERSAACAEAGITVATCVGDDRQVARARELIAERAQAAADEAARAEREAEASRLADLRNREIVWIERTKDAVRARLRNPSSAEFRNVELYRPFPGQDNPVVCGEVNSENGFGGMSGFQGFIGSGTAVGPFLEEQMAPREFNSSRAEFCRNAASPPAETK